MTGYSFLFYLRSEKPYKNPGMPEPPQRKLRMPWRPPLFSIYSGAKAGQDGTRPKDKRLGCNADLPVDIYPEYIGAPAMGCGSIPTVSR